MLIPRRQPEEEFAHLLSPLALAVAATRELPQPYLYADHLNLISEKLVRLHARAPGQKKRVLITAPPRHGKACSFNTLVPTPLGFRRHGELAVGDLILGRDGRPYPILAISEELSDLDVRLTFSDGSSVVCHERHEWVVHDGLTHRRSQVTLEAGQILARRLISGESGKRGSRYMLQLQSIEPAWGPVRELPVDPYVLGAWLGDGTSTAGCITHHDDDRHVIERVSRSFRVTSVSVNRSYPRLSRTIFSGLAPLLRRIGVLDNKHIPPDYLSSSCAQRRELLAGLIDTDGSVGSDGRVRFSNTNERLVRDVRALVCSLGYRASVIAIPPCLSTSGIQGKLTVYQVCFTPHDAEAASMPRKRHGVLGDRRKLAIVKAERTAPERGRCIQTAAPDGVYLVTESFIPTHNSELATHWFPTYALAHDPSTKIIATSYELDQAAKFGRAVRRSVIENYQFIGARLVEDSRAAHRWETLQGGGMVSAGVRGPITGKGAHIAICDDPIKDALEANSQTIRDAVWDWWTTTFLTRLEPNRHGEDAVVILILTRWHEDDLAGRIMSQPDFKEVWEHIHLPAIAESNDLLFRKPDEALWPERFDRLFLESKRAEIGIKAFQALYQGNPQPPGGISIQRSWWNYYDAPPKPEEFDQLVISVDPTFKGNSNSDYVAMGVLGRIGSQFYLMDVTHKQMNGPDTIKAITGPTGYDTRWQNLWLLIEDTASGSMICDILEKDRGRVIRGRHKSRQKEVRLSWQVNGAAALIERGAVWIQRDAPWAKKLVEEGAAFPDGKHDDLLDMLVQGLEHVLPRAWSHESRLARDARAIKPKDYMEQLSQQLHAAVRKRIALNQKTARQLEKRQFPGL